MQPLKARVHNGQVVLEKPLKLPEGHEVEVQLNDDGLSDKEREQLDASIFRGIENGRAGRDMDADEFLRELAAES